MVARCLTYLYKQDFSIIYVMQITINSKSSRQKDGSTSREWSFSFALGLVSLLRLLLVKG